MIIAFVLPNSVDYKSTPAWACYTKAQSQYPDHIVCQSADLFRNRNNCVNRGESCKVHQDKIPFDKILFIDQDIEFEPEHIQRICSSPYPIVGGAYIRKDFPDTYHAGFWNDIPGRIGKYIHAPSHGTFVVDAVGTGFLAIESRVFKDLPFPWFRNPLISWEEEGIFCQDQVSEDYGFCMQVRRYGYDVWLDADCKVRHV